MGSSATYVVGMTEGFIGIPQAALGPPVLYQAEWQSRFLDEGQPDVPKVYAEVVIDHELRGGSFAVYFLFDNGNPSLPISSFMVGSLYSMARTKTRFAITSAGTIATGAPGEALGYSATNFSVRLDGTGLGIHDQPPGARVLHRRSRVRSRRMSR